MRFKILEIGLRDQGAGDQDMVGRICTAKIGTDLNVGPPRFDGETIFYEGLIEIEKTGEKKYMAAIRIEQLKNKAVESSFDPMLIEYFKVPECREYWRGYFFVECKESPYDFYTVLSEHDTYFSKGIRDARKDAERKNNDV